MAEKASAMETNSLFEDMVTCTVCHKHFDDPRRLPCGHTYCFQCICREALRTTGDFMCPMKDGTTIQRNQFSSLPVNHTMIELIETQPNVIPEDDPKQKKSKHYSRREIFEPRTRYLFCDTRYTILIQVKGS